MKLSIFFSLSEKLYIILYFTPIEIQFIAANLFKLLNQLEANMMSETIFLNKYLLLIARVESS